jgi:hypothetical protein
MNLTPIYDPPEQPEPHPICLLMPSADEDELQSLTDDIRAHGLLNPIVLLRGGYSTAATGPPLAKALADSPATLNLRALGKKP